MIFVTVGTHEQSFCRLIKTIDNLVMNKIIKDEVIIQIGYTDYLPKYCKYKRMFSYEEMNRLAESSEIMITHGGPASIFLAQQYGKKPIVVPRQKEFNEHVDNHQVLFTQRLEKEDKVILVENIEQIVLAINIAKKTKKFILKDRTKLFTKEIERIANEILR